MDDAHNQTTIVSSLALSVLYCVRYFKVSTAHLNVGESRFRLIDYTVYSCECDTVVSTVL